MKVARVATVPFSLLGSRNVLKYISEKTDLYVVCSQGDYLADIQSQIFNPIKLIKINRQISPISDLVSIVKLTVFLAKNNFDIVHSNTPKGGLICALAAYFARVPIRCHTFTGQRWITLRGFKRKLLILCDKMICLLCTQIYTDGPSQIDFLRSQKITSKNEMRYIGKGGFAGIDFERFDLELLAKKETPEWLNDFKDEFKIGFVGRLVKEKGIEELVRSVSLLKKKNKRVSLILIGPFEDELDPILPAIKNEINNSEYIKRFDYLEKPEEALQYADVLCLPSYREGFPMAVLEAAALKIPSIVSEIVGSVDTVIPGETGLFFDLKTDGDLERCIIELYDDRERCIRLGENAFLRVKKYYSDCLLAEGFFSEYKRLKDSNETSN